MDISQPVTVNGAGTGLFEGNVVVQAYDGQSNLLAEAATVIDSPDAGTAGSGPWTVTLNLTAPTDPEGLIFAFSNSPADRSITASASVEVAFVDPGTGKPALVIIDPDNESVLDITKPISIVGGAVGLFENNVVVRALDETDNVPAEQAVIANASEPGGAGRWSASLTVQVMAGTRGRIIAFSPADDGNTPDAADEAAVTYGTAPTATPGPTVAATLTPVPSTLAITEPQNGSVVPPGQAFPASGTGSNLFENNVVVRACDRSGAILAEQPIVPSPEPTAEATPAEPTAAKGLSAARLLNEEPVAKATGSISFMIRGLRKTEPTNGRLFGCELAQQASGCRGAEAQ